MKLLNVISIAAILFTSMLLSSCEKEIFCTEGKGAITTKVLSIPDFTGVDLAEAGDVIISQGAVQEVKVTGHPNIIDKLKDDVMNDVWEIDLGKGCFDDYELTVYITVPDINFVSISGAGTITINDFVDQNDLSLHISGSGKMDLNTFDGAENLSIIVSGDGTVTGHEELSLLEKLDIKFSGVGHYNGFPIESKECKISISGTGDCDVYARDVLDVSISGAGKVYYKGNPAVSEHISGVGSVVDVN